MRATFSRMHVGTAAVAVAAVLLLHADRAWALAPLSPSALVASLQRIAGKQGIHRIDNIVAIPDGDLWVFLRDDGATVQSGRIERGVGRMTAFRLDAQGRRMTSDIEITKTPGLENATHIEALGATPSGGLIVSCLLGERDPVRYRLARLGRSRVEAVSSDALYQDISNRCVVDETGRLRVFFPSPRPELVTSLIDGESGDFRTIERVDLAPAETPQFLVWRERTTFTTVGAGEMLVAVERPAEDSTISVYRLDVGTLGLLDSVRLDMNADAYGKLECPPAIETPRWVTGRNGLWLLVPPMGGTSSSPEDHPPTATAYHLRDGLAPDSIQSRELSETGKLSDAPPGGRLEVFPFALYRREAVRPTGWEYVRTFGLEVVHLGSNGKIYAASVRDSVHVTVPAAAPAGTRGQQ